MMTDVIIDQSPTGRVAAVLVERPIMKIGAYEAKTHFSALLDRVERGEQISITRHGRVVAVLSAPPGAAERTVDEAVTELLQLRRGRRLGSDLSVRDLIDAGRQ
jgi:prevent-host-death family protein